MSLRGALGKFIPFLRPKSPLDRGDMLALRPVRNPAVVWERRVEDLDDSDIRTAATLMLPIRKDRMSKILSFWFHMPEGKTITLEDEISAELWEMCDGSNTVEQLVQHTCRSYKLNRRQGEVSVVTFMRMLTQRRLIGFLNQAKTEKKGAEHGNREPARPAGRKRQQRAGTRRRRT
ncbi:MAG: PqqD family protein [Armatimonadota bacterium]|nr:PqqD family protein [Armatimonadota bacterium]